MTRRPDIKPTDWIQVGLIDCVVARVRPLNHAAGDCEVVFNPVKPTNLNVRWSGESWEFVESGDFGGYADKQKDLLPYVQILKEESVGHTPKSRRKRHGAKVK